MPDGTRPERKRGEAEAWAVAAADQAGLKADHFFRGLIVTLAGFVDRLSDRTDTMLEGAREDLVAAIARQFGQAIEAERAAVRSEVEGRWRWTVVGASVAGLLVGAAIGVASYHLGHQGGRTAQANETMIVARMIDGVTRDLSPRDARIWAELMALNDAEALDAACRLWVAQDGSEACNVAIRRKGAPPVPR